MAATIRIVKPETVDFHVQGLFTGNKGDNILSGFRRGQRLGPFVQFYRDATTWVILHIETDIEMTLADLFQNDSEYTIAACSPNLEQRLGVRKG